MGWVRGGKRDEGRFPAFFIVPTPNRHGVALLDTCRRDRVEAQWRSQVHEARGVGSACDGASNPVSFPGRCTVGVCAFNFSGGF